MTDLLVLSHVDPHLNWARWLPLFLRSLRRATTSLVVSTVLTTPSAAVAAIAAATSPFHAPSFTVGTRAVWGESELMRLLRSIRSMLRAELDRTTAFSALLVHQSVGTIFQLPLPARHAAHQPRPAPRHTGRAGRTRTWTEEPTSEMRPDALGRVGACVPPPINAFFEVVGNDGEPLQVLAGLERVENCSWVGPILRQLQPPAARQIPLTAPKSLRKWRQQLQLRWWPLRANNSRALHLRAPRLFRDSEATSASRCNRSQRAVLMTISNYQDPSILYRWLRSLREAGASCDVVVFTDDPLNEAAGIVARKYGARLVRFIPTLAGVDPQLMEQFSNQMIKNYKFAILGQWLAKEGSTFDAAGFVDVRDAYFQRDPFSTIPCDGFSAFTETAAVNLLARASIHRDHYEKHCDTGFDAMSRFPPINSGCFFGSRGVFLDVMMRCHRKVVACGKGYDQGTFTEVLYQESFTEAHINLFTTEHGPVAHVSISRALQLNGDGLVVNEAGEPYALVHQYDRFAFLERLRDDRFPIDVSRPPFNLSAMAMHASRKHDHRSTTAKTRTAPPRRAGGA